MTNEEKKAIEHLTKKMEYHKERVLDTFVWLTLDDHYVRVLLNLVEKQDNKIKELESDKEIKNKIIDRMAEYINKLDIDEDICTKNIINPELCNEQYSNCKECIKQYFENKAKESSEIDEC